MRRLVAILVLSALAMVAAAPMAVSAQGAPIIVTRGLCICHAPVFVGIDRGIFQKHGIEIKFLRAVGGFQNLLAVHTGSAHVAFAAVTVAAQVAAQGPHLRAVFMANGDPTGKRATDEYFAIVARKGSGIREGRLEDLKGKRIGLPRGTNGHQYFFYALQSAGLDATKDVAVQHVGPGDLPSALQSGSIDALAAWEPTPLTALKMMPDAFVVYRGGNHIQFLFQHWMAPRYVSTNPGTVKRYLTGFAEAAQFVRMNPAQAAESLKKTEFQGLEVSAITDVLRVLTFDMRVSKTTLRAMRQDFEFAMKIGSIKEAPKAEEFLDLRTFDRILKERPELFKDLPPIPGELRL